MAGLPGAAGTRSSSPGVAAATLPAPRLDEAFLCSPLGGLMGAQAVSSGVKGSETLVGGTDGAVTSLQQHLCGSLLQI